MTNRWSRGTRHISSRMGGINLSLWAAAVAYNAFLALVPLTVALLGVAAAIGQDAGAIARVARALDPIAPEAVTNFITGLLRQSAGRMQGGQGWLIAISTVLAIALGSRAVVALQGAFAAASVRSEVRPPLERRIIAIALTVGGGFALLLASSLLVVGRGLFTFLVNWTGAGWIDDVWVWLRIPLSMIGLYAFAFAFYRWGPPAPHPRARLAAAVATGGVIVLSVLLGLYVSWAPDLGPALGTVGGVAAILMWLYFAAFAMLFGGLVMAPPDPEPPTTR